MRVQEYREVERGAPHGPGRPDPDLGQPREALDRADPRRQPDPGAGADRRRAGQERHVRRLRLRRPHARRHRADRGPARPAVDPLRRRRDRRRDQHHHQARAGAAVGVRRLRGRQLRDLPGARRRVRERRALELLPRREPARLRRPVRQRRARRHQRERAGRLRAAEQGRAVAHRAISRTATAGSRSPRCSPTSTRTASRTTSSGSCPSSGASPGRRCGSTSSGCRPSTRRSPSGTRPIPRIRSASARTSRPRRLEAEWYHFITPGAVEHDHGRRRVPERGGRGQGQLQARRSTPGPSSSRTSSRCSTACT